MGNFPNTYTFSKRLCEHIFEKRRGNLPLCITRPSIIGCAVHEPSDGWVDTIAAAGAIYLTIGLGILKEIYGKYDSICDQIPVDYTVNLILAASAHQSGKNELTVFNNGTSSRNPFTWRRTVQFFRDNISKQPWEKAVFKPSRGVFRFYES